MVGATGTAVVTGAGAKIVRSRMNKPTPPITAITTTAIKIFFHIVSLFSLALADNTRPGGECFHEAATAGA
jgi:hypothetical protein